jgi:glucose/arabinose dehydrogenase
MKKPHLFPLRCCILALWLCFAAILEAQVDWPQLQLTKVSGDFNLPTYIANARDGSGRLFIVEKAGRIRIIESNSILSQAFLDITNRVYGPAASDSGMLSVAFPTNYGTQGAFYVFYTRTNDQASVVSRFFVSSTNANVADPSTEQVLLVVPQSVLSGGLVAFGPDGYLYIATGDYADNPADPEPQNLGSFWGKILRIDVRNTATNGYAIPAGNPFAGNTNDLPEIWALGFRNPWRYSFDRVTGNLFIGDVGERHWEEIDFQPGSSGGGLNYGWPYLEGDSDFALPAGFDTNLLTPPIYEYPHTGIRVNGSSVTGGFVYRGASFPRMYGLYIFGDFYTGEMWEMLPDGTNWPVVEITVPSHFIVTFGEDEGGELYLADFFTGNIYQVQDSGLVCQPAFNPTGGTVNNDTILVTCASPGATIHYTTNGVAPAETDPVADTNGVVIVSGTALSAKAFRADLQPSAVTSATYNFQVAIPIFSPPYGPVTNGTPLSITSITSNATIRYTLDGTLPTTNSTVYPGPILINSNSVVTAQAYRAGFSNSPVVSVDYSTAARIQPPKLLPGNVVQVFWPTQPPFNYQLQISSNLTTWVDYGLPQSGTGGQLGFSVPMSGAETFFRLRIY